MPKQYPPTLYYRSQHFAANDPHAFVSPDGKVWQRHWPWETRDPTALRKRQADWTYLLSFDRRWELLNMESTRYLWEQGFRVASLFGPIPSEPAGRRVDRDCYDCLAWCDWDREANQIEMRTQRWPSATLRQKILDTHGPVTAQAAS